MGRAASVLAAKARVAGVEGRTVYLDGGDLPGLLGAARGLVTVNSTTGLSGLHRGLPTLVLGTAIYDLPGLTHAAGADQAARLEHFWRAPQAPDMDLYRAFRRVVMARTQIDGGFYTEPGLAQAVPLAAARLAQAA